MKKLLISFLLIFYVSTITQSLAVSLYVGDSHTFSYKITHSDPDVTMSYTTNYHWEYNDPSDKDYFEMTSYVPQSEGTATATVKVKKYFSTMKTINLVYRYVIIGADRQVISSSERKHPFSFSCRRASLTLIPNVMTLDLGQSQQLQWSISPSTTGASIKRFSSSDPTVATVTSNGTVTAQSTGMTYISAVTTEGASASCQVIAGTIIASSLSLDNSELELEIGNSHQLVATLLPEYTSNKSLTWKSSRPEVASVNDNGYVTANANGETTITVSTNDGSNLTANCSVLVQAPGYFATRGDLNSDNAVDVADVNLMIDMVLGKTEQLNKLADLDKNGTIDVGDVNILIDIVLGKVSSVVVKGTLTYTVNDVSFKMKGVDGGSFMMGASENDSIATDDEKPAHKVTLDSYYIGETEVTQALWQAVMNNNPSDFTSDVNLPVERVSWIDCQSFIAKLNALTGETFRLPTEAEWEFAARGGNWGKGYKYAGSDDIDAVAWYVVNSSSATHPVRLKQPNELGLYDMSGNVSEWCQDWFGDYSNSEQFNPIGPSSGSSHVARGGNWNRPDIFCRVVARKYNFSFATDPIRIPHSKVIIIPVEETIGIIGLRLVMEPPQ